MSSEMVEKREDAIEASRPHSFWSPLCRDFLRWRRDGVLRFVFTGVATTTATLVITTSLSKLVGEFCDEYGFDFVVSSLTAWLKHRGWRRTANGGEFEVAMVEVDVGFNS
ncbi:hypothetical protein F2Q68_00024926 [Brassica cretica]|uniref:Uncharacterized protein n=2 Tax=Brassica cretica TaxID=69181 RepID=A0ABQ7DEU9_BRACR|nr:hypothetical protein F2Q68_00024926 [Brassica cretica]KAF3576634.1 hypothetical protein DY000_02030215 [Brassica cretica]